MEKKLKVIEDFEKLLPLDIKVGQFSFFLLMSRNQRWQEKAF